MVENGDNFFPNNAAHNGLKSESFESKYDTTYRSVDEFLFQGTVRVHCTVSTCIKHGKMVEIMLLHIYPTYHILTLTSTLDLLSVWNGIYLVSVWNGIDLLSVSNRIGLVITRLDRVIWKQSMNTVTAAKSDVVFIDQMSTPLRVVRNIKGTLMGCPSMGAKYLLSLVPFLFQSKVESLFYLKKIVGRALVLLSLCRGSAFKWHRISVMASQINGNSAVCSTMYSCFQEWKH